MYDTVCTLPYASQITALAVHPTEPIFAVGLVSGHVEAHRLPLVETGAKNDHDPLTRRGSDGTGTVENLWKTRRHRGSCRSICFSQDGREIISAGMDGIVKGADFETGRVKWKLRAPLKRGKTDLPTAVWCPGAQIMGLGTESGALLFYDLRLASVAKPSHAYQPHDDVISSLTPLPNSTTQKKQFMSTGSSSIAITDLDKGVIHERDMGEEMFSSCTVLSEGMAVGGERGILRFWPGALQSSTKWASSVETRIRITKNECIDTLCTPPSWSQLLAAGLGDGNIKIVDLRRRRVIHHLQHDDIEPVTGLGFESEGRMISAGGNNVKVWQESIVGEPRNEGAPDEGTDVEQASSDISEQEEDSDSDDGRPKKRRKKRKKGKGLKVTNGILAVQGLI